ncbi:MAG: type II secretion system F family protein [Tepidisphaeraceae bacterium]|jgi:tight adherence protein B
MNQLILPVLAAITVSMLLFGIVQLVGGLSEGKRRLEQRLSGEGKSDGFDPATLTVVRRQTDIQGFSGTLAKLPFMYGMARKVATTWPSMNLAKFTFICLGMALFGGVVGTVVTAEPFIGVCVAVACGAAPVFVLNNRRNRIDRLMMDQLPEALDFLSRILRAGHSLSTGLQMMAEELPQPLANEFRRCYDQHSLGQSLEDALRDAAIRVDNADFGFFVTAILIQRQTGGDLSEVLNNISGMIRQRIRLQQHVKAKTAEGRFTGYILVCFPIVMFFIVYLLNPAYASMLLHTTTGIWLLVTAGGMLTVGTIMIHKITTLKV